MAASDEFGRHLGQLLHPALCLAGLLARGRNLERAGIVGDRRPCDRAQPSCGAARSVVTKIRDVARPPHIPENSQFPQREL